AHLEPVGLGHARQLVGPLLPSANEIEGRGRQPFNSILAAMANLAITWYGHATFLVTSPGGKRIVFDPWLTGNPKAPSGAKIDKAAVICVTHGHADHTTDVAAVARATGAPVVASFELANWFKDKGLKDVIDMGIGGTIEVKGLKIS